MWYDTALNPEIVKSIYKDEAPSLTSCKITGIHLNSDGPSVDISLVLMDFPTNPPEKWAKLSYDTVSVTLYLSVVHDVKITGWDSDNIIDIDILKSEAGQLRLFARNNFSEIDILCGFLRIGISAFKKSSSL